jgi:glycosyltransferase involved in cell wall biosynthesis
MSLMNMPEEYDSKIRYIIVSPVRDEAQYLDTTIRCVVNQTVRPLKYILVDDGSTDETGSIIERWSAEYPWIIAVHRPDAVVAKSHEKQKNRGNPVFHVRGATKIYRDACWKDIGGISSASRGIRWMSSRRACSAGKPVPFPACRWCTAAIPEQRMEAGRTP